MDISCTVCFNRYYRSFDSDFTAHFVAYHVWPALMENGTVIVKGEVVTKKTVLVRNLLRNILREVSGFQNCFSNLKR